MKWTSPISKKMVREAAAVIVLPGAGLSSAADKLKRNLFYVHFAQYISLPVYIVTRYDTFFDKPSLAYKNRNLFDERRQSMDEE